MNAEKGLTHLLVVNPGEELQDHKTACGILGVRVPASDGLTRNFLTFTCRACMATFSSRGATDET